MNFQWHKLSQSEMPYLVPINGRSVARDFPNVDLTQQIPHDIMHVIFEGVAVYEIKLVLKVVLDDRLFSVTELNNLIDNFSDGYANRSSQPTPIPASHQWK